VSPSQKAYSSRFIKCNEEFYHLRYDGHSSLKIKRRFEETFHLHLQGLRVKSCPKMDHKEIVSGMWIIFMFLWYDPVISSWEDVNETSDSSGEFLDQLNECQLLQWLYSPQLISNGIKKLCRSQWPRGLGHELSSSAQTLGSWVPISLEAWMSVWVYSVFVLSCVQVAALRRADPPSKESYRLCKRSRNQNQRARSNKGL
jgi:hypothetical protein